jgi:hypothetical protein
MKLLMISSAIAASLLLVMTFVQEAAAGRSHTDSGSRPRIGHHSGMNGPSQKGWGGGGGYHH